MYENVVDTYRTVFSELKQTDNDWDFEDMEVFASQQVKDKGSEYSVYNVMYVWKHRGNAKIYNISNTTRL